MGPRIIVWALEGTDRQFVTQPRDGRPFETAEGFSRIERSLLTKFALTVTDATFYVITLLNYVYLRMKFMRGDVCKFSESNGTLSFDASPNPDGHLYLRDVLFNVDHVIVCSIEMRSLRSACHCVQLNIDNVGRYCVLVTVLDPFTGNVHQVRQQSLKKIT